MKPSCVAETNAGNGEEGAFRDLVGAVGCERVVILFIKVCVMCVCVVVFWDDHGLVLARLYLLYHS